MDIQNLNPVWIPETPKDLDFIDFDFLTEKIISGLFRPIKSLDVCASSIYDDILKKVMDFLYFAIAFNEQQSIKKKIQQLGTMYTGWQFVSLEDRIEQHKLGNDLMPFTKDTSNSLNFHKIFIQITDNNVETTGVLTRHVEVEDMADDYITVNKNSSDNIIISINVRFLTLPILRGEDGQINQFVVIAALAHELQHIVDMYIFKDKNLLSSHKTQKFYNEVKNNVFNTNQTLFDIALTLAYILCMSESRARYTQLYKLFDMLSNDCPDSVKSELKMIYLTMRDKLANDPDKDSKAKTSAIMTIEQVEQITSIAYIGSLFVLSETDLNNENICNIFSVLGYHLCKFGYIKDEDVCEYFDYDTVLDIISGDEKAEIDKVQVIRDFLLTNAFEPYKMNVYNICAEYSDKIFEQISIDDLNENVFIYERAMLFNEEIRNACLH